MPKAVDYKSNESDKNEDKSFWMRKPNLKSIKIKKKQYFSKRSCQKKEQNITINFIWMK